MACVFWVNNLDSLKQEQEQEQEQEREKKKREGKEAEAAFLANLQKTSINYIQSMN